MFTSLFTLPVWFWSCLFLAAIAIPILIHLIRLVRFKLVSWPAMEFLLLSQKRRRKQVWLSKFLLIVTRILLFLFAIFLFANIQFDRSASNDNSSDALHLVVLDDSFSMGEISIDEEDESGSRSTCFDFAKTAILDLANNLVKQPNQRFAMVRTCDLSTKTVLERISKCDSQWYSNLRKTFAEMSPSDLSESPLRKLLDVESASLNSENIRLYVISDFRNKDWRDNQLKQVISRLTKAFTSTRLIQCSDVNRQRKNLSIQKLEPENGVLAANVPFFLTVEVRNDSNVDRNNVQLEIRKTFRTGDSTLYSPGNSNPAIQQRGSRISENKLEIRDEPTVLIKEIKANSAATAKFPILLSEVGTHVIEARMPDDDLFIDNVFHRVVEVPITNQVLLIAEDRRREANYFSWLFQPTANGTSFNTGFNIDVQSMQSIASQSVNDLSRYRAVFLLTDDLVNVKSMAMLEQYVSEGGILFVIPGNSADPKLLTKNLYRGGVGVLPFPIESAIELSERSDEIKSDITFENQHFKDLFRGESEKLISLIQFQRKFIPPRSWSANGEINIIASIRGRATTPLIVSKRLGAGYSISIMSPFDNQWNNWTKNPTFVVLIFQLIKFHSGFSSKSDFHLPAKFEVESLNGTTVESRLEFHRQLGELPEYSTRRWLPGENRDINLERKGLSFLSGNGKTQFIATQIDYRESELKLLDVDELQRLAVSDRCKLMSWNEIQVDESLRSRTPGYSTLFILLFLFFAEQALAYLLGFHSRKGPSDA